MASEEKSSMPGLVVVGSYNTDLIIWCDRIPSRGETLMGGNSEMFCGGRGANYAVAAARAGCEVMFVGAHAPEPESTLRWLRTRQTTNFRQAWYEKPKRQFVKRT
jgi:pfkB family carbohydrate kinase